MVAAQSKCESHTTMSTHMHLSSPSEVREYEQDILKSAFASLFWSIIQDRKSTAEGYALQTLADGIPTNKSEVSRWFSGRPNWRVSNVADIARVLGVDLEIRARERSSGNVYAPHGRVFQEAGLPPLQPPAAMPTLRPEPENKRVLTEFRDKHLIAMYQAGHSLGEVGKQYGITCERVRQILVREGIFARHRQGITTREMKDRAAIKWKAAADEKALRKATKLWRLTVIALAYGDGYSYQEMVALTGMSTAQIGRMVKLFGGPFRKTNSELEARRARGWHARWHPDVQ